MKRKSRLLSLLLALMMVMGLLPGFTLPAVAKTGGDYRYTLAQDGKGIVITGYIGTEKAVTIPDKIAGKPVRVIGKWAFSNNYSVTSVVLPNTLLSIDEVAFSDCTALKSVTMQKGLQYIGYGAFVGCESLTKVEIPDTVKEIDHYAFQYCTRLASVTIPDSVNLINIGAFDETKWLERMPNGLVYAGKVALLYKGKMPANTELVLKPGTTGIAGEAFYECARLKKITIPDSVAAIGNSAFSGCTGLTSISLPSSVRSIDNSAFYECSNLSDISFPSGITEIGDDAFAGTSWLASQPSGVIYVGSHAIGYAGNKSAVSSITIKSGTKSITSGAFAHCKNLQKVSFPDGLKTIGNWAFCDNAKLQSISLPKSVTSIGNAAFSSCSSLTKLTVSGSVLHLGDSAFSGCGKLTDVILEQGVQSLGGGAFHGCAKLQTISLPASLISIGAQAFYGCGKLESIKLPGSVAVIGDGAFGECVALKSMTLPAGLFDIGEEVFEGCKKLTEIKISSTNQHFSSASGVLYNKNKTQLIRCPAGTALASYAIPNTVTGISYAAFSGCGNLSKLTVPDSVTQISGSAFNGTKWYKNQPNGVVYAGKVAYAYKGKLPADRAIQLKAGTVGIADRAFWYTEGLERVTLPDSMVHIGDEAFFACYSLAAINIPAGVSYIAENAFDYYYYPIEISCYWRTTAYEYAREHDLSYKLLPPVFVSKIQLNTAQKTLGVGQAYRLKATLAPANATYQTVRWRSSDSAIATVDATGKVTPKAAGTVKITASSVNLKCVSCTITVIPAPDAVDISKASVTLGVGESYTPAVTVKPSNAQASRSWSSADNSIATVDAASGKITAKKAGKVTVTVKTYNGRTDTITVTVKPAPTSVTLPKSLTLAKGKTASLKATVNVGAVCSTWKFSSSNSAVAKVDAKTGKVTAVKAGTATITVKSYNGRTASCKLTVK